MPSAVVVHVATPATRATLFNVTVPFLNVTVPVGVPLYCGETVAVNVTGCPKAAGVREVARAVVELALLTTWLTAVEVLVVKDVLPL